MPGAPSSFWQAFDNALKLSLRHAFHYRQSPERQPDPHPIPPYHERVELVTGGRGWIRDGGKIREVVPGDLIWNKPGDWTICKSDLDAPYQCLSLAFVGSETDGCGIPRFSRCRDVEAIIKFTRETLRRYSDEAFDRLVLQSFVISRLLFWVHEDHHTKPFRDLPEPLLKAVDWLEQNFPRPCHIGDLAQVAGWSPAYLHKLFRQHLKSTPHQMLMHIRLKNASVELISNLSPIKQIATNCGFADAPTLTHAFKAHFGMTPKAYREKHMHLKTSGEVLPSHDLKITPVPMK